MDRRAFLCGAAFLVSCRQEIDVEIRRLPSGRRFSVLVGQPKKAPLLLTLADSADVALAEATKNRIAVSLHSKGYVVASVDLPCFGEDARDGEIPNTLKDWATRVATGEDLMANLIADALGAIDHLAQSETIDPNRIEIHGTSAGGCAALHLAPHIPTSRKVALIAPVVNLSSLSEFSSIEHDYRCPAADQFVGKSIFIFANKDDPRVNAKHSIELVEALQAKSISAEIHLGSEKRHNVSTGFYEQAAEWLT